MVGEKNSGVSQLCLLPSVGRGMDAVFLTLVKSGSVFARLD